MQCAIPPTPDYDAVEAAADRLPTLVEADPEKILAVDAALARLEADDPEAWAA
jgi:hypothetical protein